MALSKGLLRQEAFILIRIIAVALEGILARPSATPASNSPDFPKNGDINSRERCGSSPCC